MYLSLPTPNAGNDARCPSPCQRDMEGAGWGEVPTRSVAGRITERKVGMTESNAHRPVQSGVCQLGGGKHSEAGTVPAQQVVRACG